MQIPCQQEMIDDAQAGRQVENAGSCGRDDACLLQAGHLQLQRDETGIWQMQTCPVQAAALAQQPLGGTQPGDHQSPLHGTEEDMMP